MNEPCNAYQSEEVVVGEKPWKAMPR